MRNASNALRCKYSDDEFGEDLLMNLGSLSFKSGKVPSKFL
jgi:hypothetical protein